MLDLQNTSLLARLLWRWTEHAAAFVQKTNAIAADTMLGMRGSLTQLQLSEQLRESTTRKQQPATSRPRVVVTVIHWLALTALALAGLECRHQPARREQFPSSWSSAHFATSAPATTSSVASNSSDRSAATTDDATGRARARANAAKQIPAGWPYPIDRPAATAQTYMIVTDAPLATRVGQEILASEGTAVDAAIATAFALAVVYPEAGNIGGGGFAVVHTAKGENAALDFRETAPRAARRDMFLRLPDAQSRVGHLSCGVPGSVAGWWELHRRFGTRPWKELLEPAIRLAEQGFVVDERLSQSVGENASLLGRFPASQAMLGGSQGLVTGARWTNRDLAATLRRIADGGARGFYYGKTAAQIAAEMRRGRGIITEHDLHEYQAKWREPVVFDYRGNKIVSMPVPSAGGVTLAVIAHILEGYPLPDMPWHGTRHLHLLAEAMRRAYAERNSSLGDPEFARPPVERLLSVQYAAKLRATIGDRATPSSSIQPQEMPAPEGNHTTHFGVVDGLGNAVALTTTINALYGSGVTVAGAGFIMNNEMDDFAVKPNEPNLFGLVQGEANAVAPGKRMLSSMAPTIVLDAQGRVKLVAGARGGPKIISATWQVISNVVDFGMDVSAAVSAPRIHHQHLPDRLVYEQQGLAAEAVRALEALGHAMQSEEALGNAPAVLRGDDHWMGAADPRRGGSADGK